MYEHILWSFQYINYKKPASFFPYSIFFSELKMFYEKHCS